jgi:hypothetical protein
MSDNKEVQPTTADTSKKDLNQLAFWAESPASWFLYAERSVFYFTTPVFRHTQ